MDGFMVVFLCVAWHKFISQQHNIFIITTTFNTIYLWGRIENVKLMLMYRFRYELGIAKNSALSKLEALAHGTRNRIGR